ncbi:hypothetical protein F0P94_07635 [Adhaeribacter soli]|uniref:RHS repeat protein n=2 Tax=Adhaeribacter soli TaxID=2607655 RepID=A0A5N1J0Q1_9BACT|nr:hypothetical protein F0P94_07635 [Adhaeribacter soli]
MRKKGNALVLGLAFLLAVGCGGDEKKKGDPAPQPLVYGSRTCVPVKFTNQSGNEVNYEYNANGQLIKAIFGSVYEVVKYNSAGQVSKISTYESGANPFRNHVLFTYSSNGVLASEITYIPTTPSDSTTNKPAEVREYTYDGTNRLIEIESHPYRNPNIISSRDTYTYHANGKVLISEFRGSSLTLNQTREFEFSGGKGPAGVVPYLKLQMTYGNQIIFNKLPKTVVLTSYYPDGSVNNQNTFTFNYSYTFNSDGYPTS